VSNPPRLSAAALAALPAPVARPGYDRKAVTPGIVHLGIGAFHRAHQAIYVEDCLARGETGWGIVGASLRRPDTQEALAPQDGLYTLAVRSREGVAWRVVGSVIDLCVARPGEDALLRHMCDPRVRIVSLTVTEKGYCHDPATGALDEAHPAIRADLASPQAPSSAIGLMVEALARRRAAGVAPFTVLSCDNLPANGRTVAGLIARYARLRDPDLGAYVAGEVACPATMVDRIVPATTDADKAEVAAALGLADAWPIMTEPFSQWVVEDHFPSGRPDLGAVGVELVRDVAPHELMKLRMLNGAHSTLAYCGLLMGHETVADAIADPRLARVLDALWQAAAATLPGGLDTASYAARLKDRFANPALRHRLIQIAMDGSQKLPQRLLGSVRDRLAAGAPVEPLLPGVAAWLLHLRGRRDDGTSYAINDPLASAIAALSPERTDGAPATLTRLLGLTSVFGEDLPRNPAFTQPLLALFRRMADAGVAQALAG
jgi:fructuronate reductase